MILTQGKFIAEWGFRKKGRRIGLIPLLVFILIATNLPAQEVPEHPKRGTYHSWADFISLHPSDTTAEFRIQTVPYGRNWFYLYKFKNKKKGDHRWFAFSDGEKIYVANDGSRW
jgi:hypothetical protein